MHEVCFMFCFFYNLHIKMELFCRDQSWSFPSVIYFLVVQGLAALVALFEIYGSRFGMDPQRDSFWGHLYSFILHIGLLCSTPLKLPFTNLFISILLLFMFHKLLGLPLFS